MAVIAPAAPGDRLESIDTPALLVDLDILERNLDTMAAHAAAAGVVLRPHAKAHKCPMVARAQLLRGAVGQCCQKVGEAEAMVHGGVPDVLVTNEIVAPAKLARLASLARHARIGICVDSELGVRRLAEAAEAFGAEFRVLVEIDVGQGRCGVPPGEPAVELARLVAGDPKLELDGLQAYHGAAQAIRDHGERSAAIEGTLRAVEETRAAFAAAGLPCRTVTGGGTGTYPMEAGSGLYTEIQPGSYVFMDHSYVRNEGPGGASHFSPSLFVLAEVMSRPAPDRAVVDAGTKSISTDGGLPEVAGRADLVFRRASDEHGQIEGPAPALGERLRLVTGHCDTTVGLHDWLVGLRGERVEVVWPITGRGQSR